MLESLGGIELMASLAFKKNFNLGSEGSTSLSKSPKINGYINNYIFDSEWSRSISLFILLALMLAFIPAGSAQTTIPVTVAGAFNYNDVNGAGNSHPSCYNSGNSWGGVTGSYVSYGTTGSFCTCNNGLYLDTKSGFGYVKNSITSVVTGTPFLLGTLTHYNHPICINYQGFVPFNYIPLDITLTIGGTPYTFTYNMYLHETPNSPPCPYAGTIACSDKVYWGSLGSTTTFSYGGKTYTLEILGFDKTCAGGSSIVSEFITEERTNNVACFYAQITECIVTIDANPSPQFVCPPNLNTASFSVSATGPALTYQWYKEAGTTDIKLTNTAPYSGVTTSTLTINPVTSAQAGDYYVVVTGSCGAAKTSTPAALSVVNAPDITMDIEITQAKGV